MEIVVDAVLGHFSLCFLCRCQDSSDGSLWTEIGRVSLTIVSMLWKENAVADSPLQEGLFSKEEEEEPVRHDMISFVHVS